MKRITISILIISILVITAAVWGISKVAPAVFKTGEADSHSFKVGIVNLDRLLELHPSYPKLLQLDQQIAAIEESSLSAKGAMSKLDIENYKKMKSAQENAGRELQMMVESEKAKLESMKTSIEAELKKEHNRINEQMKKYGKESQAEEIKQFEKGNKQAKPKGLSPLQKKMDAYVSEIKSLRERQLTAKRLELERKAQEALEAERQKSNDELNKYESEILARNQEKKLNLQMKISVAAKDEDRNALQDQLSAIQQEETKLKEAKRAEFQKEFDKKKSEEMAKMDKEIKAYQKKLDADVLAQLQAEEARLRPTLGPDAAGNEVREKYNDKQMVLINEFNKKKAALENQLKTASEESQARVVAKQKELEVKLKILEKTLMSEVLKKQQNITASQEKQNKTMSEETKNLKAQRERLYQSMLVDIGGEGFHGGK